MKQSLIVGVDVSKSTLDFFFKPLQVNLTTTNNASGFRMWWNKLQTLVHADCQVLVIMEHTGRYSQQFETFLQSQAIGYCKIAALQIKRSLGMIRGKTDKIDAERIAEYAWLRRETLTADLPLTQQISVLRDLINLRHKMVRDRSGYLCRLKEMKAVGAADADMIQMQQNIIEVFTQQIKAIEQRIRKIIAADSTLKQTHDLLTSIKGIGWLIAAYMISCTNNFDRFANARKFNCYAGLAPFKQESGSSIKNRARLSHLANKEVKTLLNLAAFSAIRHNQEMKAYYQKRVGEGKRKMSCLNIIRAKLVARMFAVVKRQTPYQPLPLAA
jgi:transposase